MRDHKFPRPEAVCKIRASPVTKLLYLGQPRRGYLVAERQEGRWAERRVKIAPTGLTKGFAEVREVLEGILRERYTPHTDVYTQILMRPTTHLGSRWQCTALSPKRRG